MQHKVSIDQLIEAGAHFGHLTRRWNPEMRGFIFGERNGIHVLDLRKTQLLADVSHDAAAEIAGRGHRFLFVGTKKQAKDAITRQAERCGAYYVTERWLGGMLTNFVTVRKSIKRLETIEKMQADGTADKLRKKERLVLDREREKLLRVFGGIRDMVRLPQALFIVDIKKEHLAIKEARTLGIPTFAIVDTNCDPRLVDYPIPANDDSIRTIDLLSGVIADALIAGKEIARMKSLDGGGQKDSEIDNTDDESRRSPRKRLRERRRSRREDGGDEGAFSAEDATEAASAEHDAAE